MANKSDLTVSNAAKVFFTAARETPKQMFSPWVAFFHAARDATKSKITITAGTGEMKIGDKKAEQTTREGIKPRGQKRRSYRALER